MMSFKVWWVGGALLIAACGGQAFGSSGDDGNAGDAGTGGSRTGGTNAGGTGGNGTGGTTGGAGSSSSGGTSSAGGTFSFTSQWAEDYDQNCTIDANCHLVVEGDACACEGCENAAVSASVLDQYQSDWEAIECPNDPPTCTAACAEVAAACQGTDGGAPTGTCGTRTPKEIKADDYDRTCLSVDDCQLIYTGEVCNPCKCGFGAVNTGGYAEYLKDIEVDCSPGPDPCDCAGPGNLVCFKEAAAEMGICVLDD
jgi:hypothetical protein